MPSKEWNLEKGLEAPWEMPLKAWVKSQYSRGSVQKEKGEETRSRKSVGWLCFLRSEWADSPLTAVERNGTKMWVRRHEDMHGPRKDLSLCSNSCPLSQWCHPTVSSFVTHFSCLQSFPAFSNESAVHIRWPKYLSFSISPANENSGFISFRIHWFDLLAVQGSLKSFLQHHGSKTSILRHSAFFIVQLSDPYMTTGKTIALTRWTFTCCMRI